MSYDVQLYSLKSKIKQLNTQQEDFFDESSNLEKFSPAQCEALKSRLLAYGYVLVKTDRHDYHFEHPEHAISVLLTDCAVYFQASYHQDAIFEACMTCSEFTDSGEFAKYDPQQDGWED